MGFLVACDCIVVGNYPVLLCRLCRGRLDFDFENQTVVCVVAVVGSFVVVVSAVMGVASADKNQVAVAEALIL